MFASPQSPVLKPKPSGRRGLCRSLKEVVRGPCDGISALVSKRKEDRQVKTRRANAPWPGQPASRAVGNEGLLVTPSLWVVFMWPKLMGPDATPWSPLRFQGRRVLCACPAFLVWKVAADRTHGSSSVSTPGAPRGLFVPSSTSTHRARAVNWALGSRMCPVSGAGGCPVLSWWGLWDRAGLTLWATQSVPSWG